MQTPDVVSFLSQVRTAATALTPESRELVAWVENTQSLDSWIMSLLKNMKAKISKGIYDPTLAVKLWKNFLDRAITLREFKITYGDWRPTPTERAAAAEHLSLQYYESLISGDYDDAFAVTKKSECAPGEKKEEDEDHETKEAMMVVEALHIAGIDDSQFRYALGEQWVAKVVSSVVEQIVSRPQLFQTMVDGIIDRIKARL